MPDEDNNAEEVLFECENDDNENDSNFHASKLLLLLSILWVIVNPTMVCIDTTEELDAVVPMTSGGSSNDNNDDDDT